MTTIDMELRLDGYDVTRIANIWESAVRTAGART